MTTAILFSSSRAAGDTFHIVKYLSDNSAIQMFNLSEYNISFYDYEHQNNADDFLPLMAKLVQFEHIIFATPMYWYSMCAQMKVFIDRLSDLLTIDKPLGRQLRGKQCSLISTGYDSNAPDCLWQPFELTAKYLGMHYKEMLYLSCPSDFKLADHKVTLDNFIDNALTS
ncbi:MAG: NAD(P)H-dependent oxidoreductase [Paraglaciecola sp.]|uniref:flavodoxin family protein n=1 Tax=Paraglaciecola sp. TaxID=1920173 RepID=UPI0032675BEE